MGSIRSWRHKATAARTHHIESLRAPLQDTINETNDDLVKAQFALIDALNGEFQAFFEFGAPGCPVPNLDWKPKEAPSDQAVEWIRLGRQKNTAFDQRCSQLEGLILEVDANTQMIGEIAKALTLDAPYWRAANRTTLTRDMQRALKFQDVSFAFEPFSLVTRGDEFVEHWLRTLGHRHRAFASISAGSPVAVPVSLGGDVRRLVNEARTATAAAKVLAYDFDLFGRRSEMAKAAILSADTKVQHQMCRLDRSQVFAVVQEVGRQLEASLREHGHLDPLERFEIASRAVPETIAQRPNVLDIAALEEATFGIA